MDVSDFIKIYDNAIKPELCAELVDKFEQASGKMILSTSKTSQFTRVDLAKEDEFRDNMAGLKYIFEQCRKKYFADTMPGALDIRYKFEMFRIKRYWPNDSDEFPTHVDAADLDSSKRFLVMFFYLNDVEVGGETSFPEANIKVPPRAGRLVMFPPHWMYPHAGEKPVSGPKYLLSTYLHHV